GEHGGLDRLVVDDRGVNAAERNGGRGDARHLRFDAHQHFAVRVDARRDPHGDADRNVIDAGLGGTGSRQGAGGRRRERLTDVDVAGLVVGDVDLRAAQDFDPTLGLEGANEKVEGLALGGKYEPTRPEGTGPADAEVAEPLEADRSRGDVPCRQRGGRVEVQGAAALEQNWALHPVFDADFLV